MIDTVLDFLAHAVIFMVVLFFILVFMFALYNIPYLFIVLAVAFLLAWATDRIGY